MSAAPAPASAAAGPSAPSHSTPPAVTRYDVRSSDVLAELRVNVLAEGTDQVVWFMERFLEDDEIVEHLVHNATRRICWTMHRPRQGWYIRLRAPSFPPRVFIPLIPPPPNSTANHPPGALLFDVRTNAPVAPPVTTPNAPAPESDADHSYPPTPSAPAPPSLAVQPPTPTPTSGFPADPHGHPPSNPHPHPHTRTTHFLLSSSQQEQQTQAKPSLFHRALSALWSTGAGPSYSFSLSVLPDAPVVTPPPYAGAGESRVALASPSSQPPPPPSPSPSAPSPQVSAPPPPAPLLTFTDTTPALTVHALSGVLTLNAPAAAALGVDHAFWLAVALTYLEFLMERESYLAALSDS
ncbi:hypothetical protein B0H11DRAFT_1994283 [Mycena galericulata]|nr:hypothetical protein B0H11DRAFT_1994283 [Mycena galericulata]